MEPYTQTNRPSTPIGNAIENSVLALRERELAVFSKDGDSAVALGLATIRSEIQRLAGGQPIRVESVERALTPSLDEPVEAAPVEMPEPELAEVRDA